MIPSEDLTDVTLVSEDTDDNDDPDDPDDHNEYYLLSKKLSGDKSLMTLSDNHDSPDDNDDPDESLHPPAFTQTGTMGHFIFGPI